MFLGVDWGGTYIKSGLVDNRGKILKKKVFSSKDLRAPDKFIETFSELVENFGRKNIKAVGVGAPGIIDTKKGFIYYLPNVEGWKNFPLKEKLEKKIKLPVFVNNDANLFALAEATFGASADAQRSLFLTLGTGLGGAVIIDGNILEGKTSACEIGHFPIDLKGKQCGCGGRGCIETFTGNKYLVQKYKKLKKINKDVTVKDIYNRALEGEKQAVKIWQDFSYALGMFLSGMINVFNPEKIVFGGGVSNAFKVFKPMLLKTVKEQAIWPQVKGLKLVRAKVKEAGVVGAAVLAQKNIK